MAFKRSLAPSLPPPMPSLPQPGFPPPPHPLIRLADSAFRVGATITAAAATVGASEVSDVVHLVGWVGLWVGCVMTLPL